MGFGPKKSSKSISISQTLALSLISTHFAPGGQTLGCGVPSPNTLGYEIWTTQRELHRDATHRCTVRHPSISSASVEYTKTSGCLSNAAEIPRTVLGVPALCATLSATFTPNVALVCEAACSEIPATRESQPALVSVTDSPPGSCLKPGRSSDENLFAETSSKLEKLRIDGSACLAEPVRDMQTGDCARR